MKRAAVFVDAGYLFAQGSVALFGSKQPRSLLVLNPEAVLAALRELVTTKTKGRELLRVYWYDAASSKGLTVEQTDLAHLDNMKFRPSLMNVPGGRRSVDCQIVADLIELARLGSICDALVLSGDEGIRPGVQIAQTYGVRVHLLGIEPARATQPKSLLQEADTTSEWGKATVSQFLSVRPVARSTATFAIVAERPTVIVAPAPELDPKIEKAVLDLVGGLSESEIRGVHLFWMTERGVPPDLDSTLLAVCRSELGRNLSPSECRHARARFREAIKSRGGAPS